MGRRRPKAAAEPQATLEADERHVRITIITAGASGMYCGSCIRDNALAAALTRRGHEVTLVPLYTPTRTDEENVSQRRVFFSGISVYLEEYVSLFRWTPWLLDRLWESPLVAASWSRDACRPTPDSSAG